MRYVNLIVCVFMLLFMAVQYNDPDGGKWMLIYSVPALWCAIAGFKPDWLQLSSARILLPLCLLLALAGMVYYWPQSSGFWKREVWWEEEAAREGMGMMIVAIALLIAWLSAFGRKPA